MSRSSGRTGTYLYGIAPAEPFRGRRPLEAPAVGGRDSGVRTIEHQGLVAVVSDAPMTRVEITRENVMGHQHVLEEVLRRADVLPASFGTVASSDEEVRERLLRRESAELRDQLEYIRGRVEVGLKVLWDRERLFAEIAAENDDLRALRDSIAGQSPDA